MTDSNFEVGDYIIAKDGTKNSFTPVVLADTIYLLKKSFDNNDYLNVTAHVSSSLYTIGEQFTFINSDRFRKATLDDFNNPKLTFSDISYTNFVNTQYKQKHLSSPGIPF